MVIELKNGTVTVDTAEVAAFIGDECRGAARAESDGLYYLMIAGEGSGQVIDLRTCIDGQIVSIDKSNTFSSDANIGDPWEPYVINIAEATAISGVNGALVADSYWYTLQGLRVGKERPSAPGVYIYKGEKVVIKSIKKL